MEKLFPVNDRIVILPRESESVSKGGIALPDTVRDKEKPSRGTVVAVGPGRVDNDGNRIPVRIGVGHQVFHGRYAGSEVELNDVTYRVVGEEDILAIVADTAEE